MNPRAFHHRLASTLPACIKAHQPVLCAVSGGIDSVVMLHALCAIGGRKNLVLRVAHVDHGLRPDSADAAEWVCAMARQMGLPFELKRVSVPAIVRRGGVSIEEAARKARYTALEQLALENAAPCVAVAHHADDQAETVLHHIVRGTGLAGLGGMPEVRPILERSPVLLVRPMLGFTRKHIEAYATAFGLEHCEDVTNEDTRLTRNRIRRTLLPYLREQFNPRVVEALVRLAHHARDASEIVDRVTGEALGRATIDVTENIARLDVAALADLPSGVRREALREILKSVGAPLQSLDYERLAAVDGLTDSSRRRRTIELPGRFAVQRRGRLLLFGPAAAIRSMTSASGRPTASTGKPRRADGASRR